MITDHNIILPSVIIFLILFIVFLFYSLVYHQDVSRIRRLLSLDFKNIPKWEILFGVVFASLLSFLLAYSVFNR
jgi:hypothetical protein